jgi:hypothetical protein
LLIKTCGNRKLIEAQMRQSSLDKIQEYKKELLELVADPVLMEIIEAYSFPNPVDQMETELDKILLEILNEKDKESNSSRL